MREFLGQGHLLPGRVLIDEHLERPRTELDVAIGGREVRAFHRKVGRENLSAVKSVAARHQLVASRSGVTRGWRDPGLHCRDAGCSSLVPSKERTALGNFRASLVAILTSLRFAGRLRPL